MNTKVYINNLAATTTERDLQDLCSPYGNVAEVHLLVGREIGGRRGSAVVTMATPQGAQAAILALDGKTVETRAMAVSGQPPSKNGPLATG